ncbi:CapA family protein [Gluconacetobacter azotocaptans]|uniref:CapA family protein n=1 Tax=Gluconacetobacter azotocaptans TaxID=142834 RepID=UPI001958A4E5|nr:CapA family protein [Gluconacetobacter azotocaptans]MBM9400683.1 CapA family protein [Gluconacetobacter azotocaptans]
MKVSLTGDSILFRRLNSRTDGMVSPLFDMIRDCDISFTNLELVPNDFLGDPALDHGGTHFGAPAWVLDELSDAGFDLFASATNHSLDYSISGLRQAIEAMDRRQIQYAGVGRNLEEARRPVYATHPKGAVAMLSCVSTFARGQEAAEQTNLMAGRPGVSPLHFTLSHHVTADEMATLRAIYEKLGLEKARDDKIQLGFGYPPAPGTLSFEGVHFTESDHTKVHTTPNEKDVAGIVRWIGEARLVSDVVIVSVHSHESGYNDAGEIDVEIPADFLRLFAERAIDAGADIVACHGPHLLRGMEIYKNRPIFYSLGNFIGQNELVERLPADSYAAYKAGPEMTPHRIYKNRSNNDRKGFPADRRFWETVMPICTFGPDGLQAIEIHPVSLGLGQSAHRRGVPFLARGAEGQRILSRFADLSRPFGVTFDSGDNMLLCNL